MKCPVTSYGLQTSTLMTVAKNQYIILGISSDEFCTNWNKNVGFKANFHLGRYVKSGCTTQFLSASNLTLIRRVKLSISSLDNSLHNSYKEIHETLTNV